MTRRLVAPGLAAVALLCFLGGVGGFASLVLLAAIVAGAARVLETVGEAAEGRSDSVPAVLSAAGLAWLVAAGAARMPLLAVGLFACAAIERLVEPETRSAPAVVPAEPVELSRAA